jgi:hypothetical protein
MYTITDNKKNNIEVAKSLLLNLGLNDFRFCDYSSTYFGTSVYFLTNEDKKIRVSDHSVTSNSRMQNEILFSFDMKTLKRDGSFGLQDNQKSNKLMAKNFYKIIN